MRSQVCLLPSALAEIVVESSRSRQLTISDRDGLMAALLDESLTEDDRQPIDRLLYALRRGRLTASGLRFFLIPFVVPFVIGV
jgi:hypothetical protein